MKDKEQIVHECGVSAYYGYEDFREKLLEAMDEYAKVLAIAYLDYYVQQCEDRGGLREDVKDEFFESFKNQTQ